MFVIGFIGMASLVGSLLWAMMTRSRAPLAGAVVGMLLLTLWYSDQHGGIMSVSTLWQIPAGAAGGVLAVLIARDALRTSEGDGREAEDQRGPVVQTLLFVVAIVVLGLLIAGSRLLLDQL